MTEKEWLESSSPEQMLGELPMFGVERKLRFFVCACNRRLWEILPSYYHGVIEAGELLADEELTWKQRQEWLETAREHAEKLDPSELDAWVDLAICAATGAVAADLAKDDCAERIIENCAKAIAHFLSLTKAAAFGPTYFGERKVQCALLRDIFGNPFRPAAFNPAWRAWRDGTLTHLAQAIYDDRAFDRLPILADALEEAGCADRGLLDHCRGPGPHVRGCWAVDLVLGKS